MLYIGAFCAVVSTVVTGVAFLLSEGDCGDGFSMGLTGVGVLFTIFIVCFLIFGYHMTVSLRY